MIKGKIYQLLSGFYDVYYNGKLYRTRARGNFRKKGIKPLVGDYVEFKNDYLLKVLPRYNQLIRPALANVDQAIIVTSVKQPSFSLGLLDRQLIMLSINKIKPIIYLSKTDLLNNNEKEYLYDVMNRYRNIGYQVIIQNNGNNSLNVLIDKFKDKETVFMGQTGVGKSTLLNKIKPDLNLKTNTISKTLHRGKHTTRRIHLMNINNGLVGDTPGFSSYEVYNINSRQLKNYFPEFVKYSKYCKFRECLHVNEPHCKIKELVQQGKIMHSRYNNYLDLYNIIKNRKPIYNKKKK